MNIEGKNIPPLTPAELAKINKKYFEMEAKAMEEKTKGGEVTTHPAKDIQPLTPEQLAKINKEYFEMEEREKNKEK
ncbi:MAG: hypothetical protein AAB895_03570 [Patescibacteria group bacterium]